MNITLAIINKLQNAGLGKVAYDAYCAKRGWKSVRGEPLPQFGEQSQELQDAWTVAANAVAEKFGLLLNTELNQMLEWMDEDMDRQLIDFIEKERGLKT